MRVRMTFNLDARTWNQRGGVSNERSTRYSASALAGPRTPRPCDIPAGRRLDDRRGGGRLAVIDRNDIELSGMKNVWDLLRSRTGYNNFRLHRPFVLGSGRVTILVNGRRVSDSTIDLDARLVRRVGDAGFRPRPHAVPDRQRFVRPVKRIRPACPGERRCARHVTHTSRACAR